MQSAHISTPEVQSSPTQLSSFPGPATQTTINSVQSGTQRRTATRRSSVSINTCIPPLSQIRQTFTDQMHPPKKVGDPPSFWQGVKTIICASWLNVLLLCIPVSWALHFALPSSNSNDTIIFIFSFLAIVPLAKLLAFATDELSLRVGQTLAGLLNATLGNAVELIVAIIALVKCELQIVQSSLVGSILSNLLLVLGMCFFAGGMRFSEQGFGISATQLNSSLLTISVIAVLLPAAFHFSNNDSSASNGTTSSTTDSNAILSVSHGSAIILLFIYGCYLTFQLFSHTALYDDKTVQKSTKYAQRQEKGNFMQRHFPHGQAPPTPPSVPAPRPIGIDNADAARDGVIADGNTTDDHTLDLEGQTEVDEEKPQMSVPLTACLLISVTVCVALTAEFLVDSINGLTASGHISKEFVGVILLPIVGNAAEHVTAVTVSLKDKLTLSLGVAVGSSIQIALFVIPFIVTLGWIMGKPLSLLFDPYESIVLFLTVLIVNYVVQDGRSNWLEGMILMCLYLILAVTFWYYPGNSLVPSSC